LTDSRTYAVTIGVLLAIEGVLTRALFFFLEPVWGGLERMLQWNFPEPHAELVIAAILAACFLFLSWIVASRSWATPATSAYWIPPALAHVGFVLYVSQPAFYKARYLVPFFLSCLASPVCAYAGYRLGRRRLTNVAVTAASEDRETEDVAASVDAHR